MSKLGVLAYLTLVITGLYAVFFINSLYKTHKNDLAVIAAKKLSYVHRDDPLKMKTIGNPTVKKFNLIVTEDSYSPSTIKVNRGDVVKIYLYSASGYNNFVIPALDIRSKLLATNKRDEFSFQATMSGIFEFKSDSFTKYGFSPSGNLIVE